MKKTILGISLGAVFAIGMISIGIANFATANESPDFMTFNATSDGSVLKDHAAGKDPAKNPAHWELIANVTGNMTQISVDYNATGINLGAVGIGILNTTDNGVYAVTIHNDTDSSAAPFQPHGHKFPVLEQTDAQCENGLWLDFANGEEIGEAKIEVIKGVGANYTIVELDDIPWEEQLEGVASVCSDYTEDTTTIYAFHVTFNGTNICATLNDLNGVFIDQQDGPDKTKHPKAEHLADKNKNHPTRVGGFEDNDPTKGEYCPS